jgi:8-oxo-dGTP pyrophosphatase MutT (NUDIX family)
VLIVEIKSKNKTFASIVICFNPDNKVLLLKRAEHASFAPGQWAFAGGHSEEGENFKEAAIRETHEETGLKLLPEDLIKITTFKSSGQPPVHVFGCKSFEGTVDMKRVADEHDDYRWVSLDDVSDYDTAPHTPALIQKAISMF